MPLTDQYVKTVCKPGQKGETCRYLGLDADGWRCLKLGSLKATLDYRAQTGTISARGDNCPGLPS